MAGPINGRSDADCRDWRERAKELIGDRAQCLDPMDRDYRGKELAAVVEIVEGDKRDIDSCDALLVWFDRPSVGTSMEVLYAWDLGKQVVVVNRSGAPVSPWLNYHSSCVVMDLDEAVESLVGAA